MTRRLLAVLMVLAIILAACGGAGSAPTQAVDGSPGITDAGQVNQGGTGGTSSGSGSGDEVTPEASGPLAPNTIRIGDQVWERTLPMTTGQCFLSRADLGIPDWGLAWGTLDGDEEVRFSASHKQDGTFEVEVTNNVNMQWGAGPRFQQEAADLVIELDFDTLTISGHGTFRSLPTGERAMGSFEFTCEPEG